jgi:exodeoxyribonuclease VII large subunit
MSSNETNNRRVYALSEITGSITRMFEKFYENPYWIKAEISALNLYPVSGHCFPLMVEKSGGKVKAQLKATIWKDDLFNIARKFEQVTGETLREGLNIMFLAYVRFSSTYGLSLQIIDIEPLYTLGEMARDKMNTILALKKDGVFDMNRSLPVPLLLKNLAIISVESSKGYNDLMVTLQNNKQGYRVISRLFPAVMQGKGAVETITARLLEIRQKAHLFDAVVIVRGGGDDVGLSCYDQYTLAREVAVFPLPVITGIGHSTNETVTEMVACLNKITPTDVAHYILGGFAEQDNVLRALQQSFTYALADLLESRKDELSEYIDNIVELTNELINEQRMYIKAMLDRFVSNAGTLLLNTRLAFGRFEMSATHYPARMIGKEQATLQSHVRMLYYYTQHFVNSHQQKLSEKEHRLRLLDPKNVLQRGYAMVRIGGKVISDSTKLLKGDKMEVETMKMRILGTVDEVIT